MAEERRVTMMEELDTYRALLLWFCNRVSEGSVSSVRTYAVFQMALRGELRGALDGAREIGPDLPEVF